MKKAILSFALLLAVMFNYAQESSSKTTADVNAKLTEKVEKVAQKLSLTTAQKDKLYAVTVDFTNYKNSLAALKESDPKAYAVKVKAKSDEYFKKLETVLSAQQIAGLKEMMAENKAKSAQ